MKILRNLLLATVCGFFASASSIQAQGVPSVNVGFRSESRLPIVVQGTSLVNGMQRRGQPLLMTHGKMAFENNVPAGVRLYTIYDANQPSRVLLRDFPIQLHGGDAFFILRSAPNNPLRLLLVPDMP